jgi:hypothetical protein
MTLSIMTLNKMTLGTMTLGILTISIMAPSRITLRIIALYKKAFSITLLSIKTLRIMPNYTQYNDTQ